MLHGTRRRPQRRRGFPGGRASHERGADARQALALGGGADQRPAAERHVGETGGRRGGAGVRGARRGSSPALLGGGDAS